MLQYTPVIMHRYFILTIFYILFHSSVKAQSTQDYQGFLVLQDTLMINYKVHVELAGEKLTGYTISDANGPHETKSTIVGSYESDKDILTFRETGIVYTKSNYEHIDFCNVYFRGYVKRLSDKTTIQGEFKGYYDDLSSCMDGKIMLGNVVAAEKRMKKLNRLVDKKIKKDTTLRIKYDVDKLADSLKINVMKVNEQLNIHWPHKQITIELWDNGQEDGDKIALKLDDQELLTDYEVKNYKWIKTITLLDKDQVLTLQALNTGEVGSNTAQVILRDEQGNVTDFYTRLKAGEVTRVRLIKSKIN